MFRELFPETANALLRALAGNLVGRTSIAAFLVP
jgi:hypothetical protein